MDIEKQAIERLKLASEMSLQYYGQPLIITTSGGKDSDVCLKLAEISGIPYEVMHSHTTADAPQTVRHVRNQFRKLELTGIHCTEIESGTVSVSERRRGLRQKPNGTGISAQRLEGRERICGPGAAFIQPISTA